MAAQQVAMRNIKECLRLKFEANPSHEHRPLPATVQGRSQQVHQCGARPRYRVCHAGSTGLGGTRGRAGACGQDRPDTRRPRVARRDHLAPRTASQRRDATTAVGGVHRSSSGHLLKVAPYLPYHDNAKHHRARGRQHGAASARTSPNSVTRTRYSRICPCLHTGRRAASSSRAAIQYCSQPSSLPGK